MLADSEALPHSLLASHLYSPASLLLIFVNTNASLCVREPALTLIHNTVGRGIPEALQVRFTLSPSVTALFSIAWMDEGTAGKQRQQRIKKCF